MRCRRTLRGHLAKIYAMHWASDSRFALFPFVNSFRHVFLTSDSLLLIYYNLLVDLHFSISFYLRRNHAGQCIYLAVYV